MANEHVQLSVVSMLTGKAPRARGPRGPVISAGTHLRRRVHQLRIVEHSRHRDQRAHRLITKREQDE